MSVKLVAAAVVGRDGGGRMRTRKTIVGLPTHNTGRDSSIGAATATGRHMETTESQLMMT